MAGQTGLQRAHGLAATVIELGGQHFVLKGDQGETEQDNLSQFLKFWASVNYLAIWECGWQTSGPSFGPSDPYIRGEGARKRTDPQPVTHVNWCVKDLRSEKHSLQLLSVQT